MGHVILVNPGHGGAGGNRQGRGRETEVVDLDLVLASGTVLFAGNQPGVARVHKGEGQNNQTCESQTESSFLHLLIRSFWEIDLSFFRYGASITPTMNRQWLASAGPGGTRHWSGPASCATVRRAPSWVPEKAQRQDAVVEMRSRLPYGT